MAGYNDFNYLSDFEAKKAIIEVGKRMYYKGFVASNDGNISCKVGPNAIWTTPTGVSKGYMNYEMLVKIDLEGKVIAGKCEPSSEVKMHIRVYKENPEVMAVTHAHPPVATSFAIAGISLDRAILPEAVVNLGSVPIAHYATPGSTDVPDSIAPFCKSHNAVLLANHGALTWGKNIFEAYHRLESLEYYATVLMYTGKIIGQANELSCNQVNELITIREKLGITSGGMPPCSLIPTNTKDVVTNTPIDKLRTEAKMAPFLHIVPQVDSSLCPKSTTYSDTSCGCSKATNDNNRNSENKSTEVKNIEVGNNETINKEDLIKELTKRITQQVLESLKR